MCIKTNLINSLWPNDADAIWWHKYGSVDSGNGLVPSGVSEWASEWVSKSVSEWILWRHQVITWTNVDLSSIRPLAIYLRAISPKLFKISFSTKCLKLHIWKYCNISQGPISHSTKPVWIMKQNGLVFKVGIPVLGRRSVFVLKWCLQ